MRDTIKTILVFTILNAIGTGLIVFMSLIDGAS